MLCGKYTCNVFVRFKYKVEHTTLRCVFIWFARGIMSESRLSLKAPMGVERKMPEKIRSIRMMPKMYGTERCRLSGYHTPPKRVTGSGLTESIVSYCSDVL